MDNHDALKAVAEAAPKGPWDYRPDKHDDWGLVRGGEETEFGRGVICQAKDPSKLDREVLNQHREAGTDPWETAARHIATFDPPTVLALLADLAAAVARADAAEARVERLRSAVEEAIALAEARANEGR